MIKLKNIFGFFVLLCMNLNFLTTTYADSFCEYEGPNHSVLERNLDPLSMTAIVQISNIPANVEDSSARWIESKIIWIVDKSYDYRNGDTIVPYEFAYLKDRGSAYRKNDILTFSALIEAQTQIQDNELLMVGMPIYKSLTQSSNVCGYRPKISEPGYYAINFGRYMLPNSVVRIENFSALAWLFSDTN